MVSIERRIPDANTDTRLGKINVISFQITPTTDTVLWRGVIANKKDWAVDDHDLIPRKYHEPLAIDLMAAATAVFLMRAVICRLEIDFILAVMSTNLLCRELHFVGTDNAVVVVAGLVLIRKHAK